MAKEKRRGSRIAPERRNSSISNSGKTISPAAKKRPHAVSPNLLRAAPLAHSEPGEHRTLFKVINGTSRTDIEIISYVGTWRTAEERNRVAEILSPAKAPSGLGNWMKYSTNRASYKVARKDGSKDTRYLLQGIMRADISEAAQKLHEVSDVFDELSADWMLARTGEYGTLGLSESSSRSTTEKFTTWFRGTFGFKVPFLPVSAESGGEVEVSREIDSSREASITTSVSPPRIAAFMELNAVAYHSGLSQHALFDALMLYKSVSKLSEFHFRRPEDALTLLNLSDNVRSVHQIGRKLQSRFDAGVRMLEKRIAQVMDMRTLGDIKRDNLKLCLTKIKRARHSLSELGDHDFAIAEMGTAFETLKRVPRLEHPGEQAQFKDAIESAEFMMHMAGMQKIMNAPFRAYARLLRRNAHVMASLANGGHVVEGAKRRMLHAKATKTEQYLDAYSSFHDIIGHSGYEDVLGNRLKLFRATRPGGDDVPEQHHYIVLIGHRSSRLEAILSRQSGPRHVAVGSDGPVSVSGVTPEVGTSGRPRSLLRRLQPPDKSDIRPDGDKSSRRPPQRSGASPSSRDDPACEL